MNEKDLEEFDELLGELEDCSATLTAINEHLSAAATVETADDMELNIQEAITETSLLLMGLKALRARAAKLANKEKTK